MKVAINAAFLHRPDTGSGQYLLHLVEEFRQPDYGIEVQLIEPRSDSNLEKLRFEQLGFPFMAKALRADLAHVPYFGSAFVPRAPTVVTIHDLIPLVLPLYRGSLRVRAYTQLVAAAAKRAHAIIADSESSKRDIVRMLGIDERKVRVIYLAADARYRRVTDAATLEAVRAKYQLPDIFVLYLGGFDQRKNVMNLVRAFVKVAKGLPDHRLVLAGYPPPNVSPLFPDVVKLVDELELGERVRFIGGVSEEDKPALYTLAGCFVFPSYYEGFGLPPLEALACGAPVVAGDTSSLVEIIGNAGFLIRPDDVNRMAGAIIASIVDEPLRRELIAKGLAQAAKFSWQQCARETVAVYREVLNH
jgi:glycosyltransferase involved in cell wall biosynthesis